VLSTSFRIELLFGELKIPFPDVCSISMGIKNIKGDESETQIDNDKHATIDKLNPRIVKAFQPNLSDRYPLMGDKRAIQIAGGIIDNPTTNGSRLSIFCM
jgi:hypothetical protein